MSDEVWASAFADALARGLVTSAEVVEWVDRRIESLDRPHHALVDASLAGRDVNTLISALREFAGAPDRCEVARVLLAIMSRALDREPTLAAPIAHTLYSMAIDEDVPFPDVKGWMLYFDDAIDLARSGRWGTESVVREELTLFLHAFRRAFG